MKKQIQLLIGLAVIALALGACSKKDKGNGNFNYAPNSCYNSGGPNQYQWVNGTCRDVQQNTTVSQSYCTNASSGYSYDARCNYYGGGNVIPGGYGGYGANACATAYGPTWTPVYMPQAGGYVCINSSTYNYINSYYYGMSPYMYGNTMYGCTPGATNYGYPTNCSCKSIGGTLGWFFAGASIGICF